MTDHGARRAPQWQDMADAVTFATAARSGIGFDKFMNTSGGMPEGAIVRRWVTFLKWHPLVFLDQAE